MNNLNNKWIRKSNRKKYNKNFHFATWQECSYGIFMIEWLASTLFLNRCRCISLMAVWNAAKTDGKNVMFLLYGVVLIDLPAQLVHFWQKPVEYPFRNKKKTVELISNFSITHEPQKHARNWFIKCWNSILVTPSQKLIHFYSIYFVAVLIIL